MSFRSCLSVWYPQNPMCPQKLYQQKIELEGYIPDAGQERAVAALERLKNELVHPEKNFLGLKKKQTPKGVYMHGGVGRGKSMLMDIFYQSVRDKLKARRVHFHAFMIETHDWLHKRRGDKVDTILPDYAKHVAKHTKVLCFDEFYVTDVADAMILGRLFTALFDRGVVVVSTSNWTPDRLYEGGLQRDRFLPFIALLKDRMEVVHLDSDNDYRMLSGEVSDVYFTPLGKMAQNKADNLFAGFTDCAEVTSEVLKIKGREIQVERTAAGVARFTFAYLCEQPHGAEDYLAIADKYHTVFLEGVPKMGYDRKNEVKRLMNLIDILYDNNIRLVVTADASPDKLYYGDDHAFEFERTISRLTEMQSLAYLEKTES
ncbi:MAG: cell division protein ZapE [Pseudomonadota bacterium]